MITFTVTKWYRTWERVSQQDRIWFIVSLIIFITCIAWLCWSLWGKYVRVGRLPIFLTCGKVANLWKSLKEQKSWRLTQDVMMSRHIVKRIRLPSFFPGPKIWIKPKKVIHLYYFNLISSRLIQSNLWQFHFIWHSLSQPNTPTLTSLEFQIHRKQLAFSWKHGTNSKLMVWTDRVITVPSISMIKTVSY